VRKRASFLSYSALLIRLEFGGVRAVRGAWCVFLFLFLKKGTGGTGGDRWWVVRAGKLFSEVRGWDGDGSDGMGGGT
jgi:hypothetical protein